MLILLVVVVLLQRDIHEHTKPLTHGKIQPEHVWDCDAINNLLTLSACRNSHQSGTSNHAHYSTVTGLGLPFCKIWEDCVVADAVVVLQTSNKTTFFYGLTSSETRMRIGWTTTNENNVTLTPFPDSKCSRCVSDIQSHFFPMETNSHTLATFPTNTPNDTRRHGGLISSPTKSRTSFVCCPEKKTGDEENYFALSFCGEDSHHHFQNRGRDGLVRIVCQFPQPQQPISRAGTPFSQE